MHPNHHTLNLISPLYLSWNSEKKLPPVLFNKTSAYIRVVARDREGKILKGQAVCA
jgi:hypothetical protein